MSTVFLSPGYGSYGREIEVAKIDPIRIVVPTTVEITVKQAQIFPYREIRPLRDKFDTSELVEDKYKTGGTRGDWNKLLEFHWKSKPRGRGSVREIEIPWKDWRQMCYSDKIKTELLADPANKVGLFFVGSKNFRQIMDQKSGTEMFVIDDIFYRRMTWRSLGYKNNEAGIVWRTADSITFFLYPCEKLNQREYKTAILDGIGIEVMKRDEPVPEEVEA
jgi:hypothetical protein